MQLNKEQIVDLLKSRATNYKDYKGIKRAYVPDDDFDYIADKILTLMQPIKDIQPNLQQTVCTTLLELLQQMLNEEQIAYMQSENSMEADMRLYNEDALKVVIKLINARLPIA